jgi:hypothetical protein
MSWNFGVSKICLTKDFVVTVVLVGVTWIIVGGCQEEFPVFRIVDSCEDSGMYSRVVCDGVMLGEVIC